MAHKKRIIAICSYLNSKDIITISVDGTLCMWSVDGDVKLSKALDCGEQISVATFSRESRLIAIGLQESGTVKIVDAETGSFARTFPNVAREESDFTLLEFSTNSAYLLTADTSAIIRVSHFLQAFIILFSFV